jgi:hypothetical protein
MAAIGAVVHADALGEIALVHVGHVLAHGSEPGAPSEPWDHVLTVLNSHARKYAQHGRILQTPGTALT